MFRNVVYFLAFGLILFGPISAFPQVDNAPKKEISSPQPTSCEVIRTIFDRAFVDFQKLEDSSSLIIITRLGSNESRRSLTLGRMRDIEKFIQFRKVTDRYVLAEANGANNLGTAEIYVGGKLTGAIYFAPNSKQLCESLSRLR